MCSTFAIIWTKMLQWQFCVSISSYEKWLSCLILLFDWDYRRNLRWFNEEVAGNAIIGPTFTVIGACVLRVIKLCKSRGPTHIPFTCGWWFSVQSERVPNISVNSLVSNKCSDLSISWLKRQLMKSNASLGSSQMSWLLCCEWALTLDNE